MSLANICIQTCRLSVGSSSEFAPGNRCGVAPGVYKVDSIPCPAHPAFNMAANPPSSLPSLTTTTVNALSAGLTSSADL
ncbi:hypothetical protein VTO73DRAFT_11698 [Trametes versicolor]